MKTSPARLVCLTVLMVLVAGCAKGPGGGVTVEGALAGTKADPAAAPVTLTLTHRYGASLRRVVEAPDPRIGDLTSMTLRVTSLAGGPFRDEFLLATVVTEPDPTESAGNRSRLDGGDPDWVRRRLGKLALLGLRVDDRSSGKSLTRTFASGSTEGARSTWLARLDNDDQVIPWTIDEADPRCRAVSPSSSLVAPPTGQSRDCFDLRTLSGMVLAHVAKAVTEGLDDGPLPSLVTAARHDLFIVPSVASSTGAGGSGFGFIYAAELQFGARGGPARGTIYAPIVVHLRPATSSTGSDLEAVFTPLGAAPWSAIDSSRVALTHEGGPVQSGLAREIRSVILESLERAALPPIAVDGTNVPVGPAVGRMIAAVAPRAATATPYSSALDVIALPSNRSTITENAVSTRLLSLPRVSTRIAIGGGLRGFLANRTAQLQAVTGGDGTVIATTSLDPPGRIRRVTTFSPVQTFDSYELRILH